MKTFLNETLLSASTSALPGGEWTPSRSGHFTSGKTAPSVLLVEEWEDLKAGLRVSR